MAAAPCEGQAWFLKSSLKIPGYDGSKSKDLYQWMLLKVVYNDIEDEASSAGPPLRVFYIPSAFTAHPKYKRHAILSRLVACGRKGLQTAYIIKGLVSRDVAACQKVRDGWNSIQPHDFRWRKQRNKIAIVQEKVLAQAQSKEEGTGLQYEKDEPDDKRTRDLIVGFVAVGLGFIPVVGPLDNDETPQPQSQNSSDSENDRDAAALANNENTEPQPESAEASSIPGDKTSDAQPEASKDDETSDEEAQVDLNQTDETSESNSIRFIIEAGDAEVIHVKAKSRDTEQETVRFGVKWEKLFDPEYGFLLLADFQYNLSFETPPQCRQH
ncbi:hypothetical protein EYC80_004670 [Monilinia laxa]|uniref:Uncharacterized protein n=1 Tax=Monilinia laxa TaxID=61186 RepID=A0A5N6KHG1_MONLA|nr:hypothetical protein EYC80_004670 [Monilinia laxa]